MRRRRLFRKLALALAGLVGGFAFACSPSPEAPPLAPRPVPVQPLPKSEPRQPLPGAPDPIPAPDAGVPITRVEIKAHATPDAGIDALVLPEEIPDALPPDARKQPESTAHACC